MIGIKEIGVSIPRYRMSTDLFKSVWGKGTPGINRSVANYDEDVITLASDAVLECIGWSRGQEVGGIFMASTTFPYLEKQNSAIVATVADAPRNIVVTDFTGSLRASTSALRAALDAVASGNVSNVVVAAADVRLAEPGSPRELELGDGGVALWVDSGDDDLIASVDAYVSLTEEFTDEWRRNGDRYINIGDPRFIRRYGYERLMQSLLQALLEKTGLEVTALDKVIFYAPDVRAHGGIARLLGINPAQAVAGDLFKCPGNIGAAQVFLMLARCLEEAKPGEQIAVLGYGSGGDAFLLKVREGVKKIHDKRPVQSELACGRPLDNYGRYLFFRDNVWSDKPEEPYSSLALWWREGAGILRLQAPKCKKCGAVQYPPREICWQCGQRGEFSEYRLQQEGLVITLTRDYLIPVAGSPVTLAVADIKGGGRLHALVTDAPESLQIGDPVKLCFRMVHQGEKFYNYFWKFRAV